MLRKPEAELVKRYSFIDSVEIKFAKFIIHYTVKGVKKIKILPIRTTGDQLQKAIKKIRKEMGVSVYGKGQKSEIFIV